MEPWDRGSHNASPAAMSDQNDGQDAVTKKLLSRRTHRKSRTGCGNCKTRRIKCDETKPECVNCSKHDLRCDYVTGVLGQVIAAPAPSTAEPPKRKRGRPRKIHNPSPAFAAPTPQPTPQPNAGATPALMSNAPSPTSLETSEDDLVDLDLMHHFSLEGHGNFFGSPPLSQYWKSLVPKIGFSHPFLLHLALGYAALSLAHARPNRKEHYILHAERHYTVGVRQVTALLPQLNEDNCVALYLSVSVIAIYAMSKGPRPGEYLLFGDHGSAEWLPLFRGVNSIIGLVYHTLSTGELAIMFKYRGVRDYGGSEPTPPTDWRRHLEDFRIFISESDDPNTETYLGEVMRLNQSYLAVWGNQEEKKQNPYMSSIFAWMYRTSNDFILCIQQKQPLALLIFAFLGVLMTSFPPENHWFMQGWPQHVVAGAYNFLPPDYRHRIHWHVEQVGWIPGTPTTP
ncbi:uncharacterized protein J3D65DRAFT_111053 [Phyllosticta citribraziliensis]|uniref:Zn(2)-C6 fungal-type domain-containing protein n=1 Tax=Phyllosticta citribraziliensis TaxID=989973 RepID=A0ABR1L7W9_9PEZI